MLYFERWKMIAIIMAVLGGFLFAFPNMLAEDGAQSLPEPLASSRLNLGLDLQGGVYLLAQIDQDELINSRLENLNDDLCSIFRQVRGISCSTMSYTETGVKIRISDAEKIAAIKEADEDLMLPLETGIFGQAPIVELEILEDEPGFVTYNLTQSGSNKRLNDAVEKAIEVIRIRIDKLGVTEPQIQRQGTGRILVQAPGASDAQRLKDLIGEPAKMTFH